MNQDWSLTPADTTPPRVRGTGMIWSGAVLLVVGLVLVVAGIVGVGVAAAGLVTGFGEPVTTPATVTRTLDGGTTYDVYELTTSGRVATEDSLLASVVPADITVTGPSGVSVPVSDASDFTQTFTNNGRQFVAVASFTAPVGGSYEVTIATEGAEVLVAPSFSVLGRAVGWIAAIAFGGLIALIGLVLLIVGLVRRSASKKAAALLPAAYGAMPYQQPTTPMTPQQPVAGQQPVAPPATAAPRAPVAPPGPPAGWYPDPARPGGQRYWDGAAWTQHTA